MSPLAILYFLLASSPVYNNWRHESPLSTSSWAFPSTFDRSMESSIFGGEFNNFESMMPFESIFNNEWTSACPSTRRHLVREMTGLEMPSMFESHSELSLIKLIKRIAKVNPIMIEKLLTRPETRFAVERVLRTVAPESIFAVEKMINKHVPFYLREKVTRKVVKALLTSSLLSNKMSRRSIVNEMYPTRHFESSIFESTPFSTLFNVEEPMTRIMIEKVLRNAEVSPIVLAKVIRRLVKSNVFSHESVLPIELLSTLSHVEPKFAAKLIKKALRHEMPVEVVLAKIVKRLVKSNVFEHESIFSTLSHVEPKFAAKKIEKVIRRLVKSNVFEHEHEFSTLSHLIKKALRHELPVELSTLSHVEPKFVAKKIEKVIRRLIKSNVFEHEFEFPTLSHKLIKKALRHELPVELLSTLSTVEPKIVKLIKKALRHEMPVEVVLAKIVKRLVKKNVFEHESIFSTVKSTKNIEKVCRVCESVCEPEHIFESSIFSTVKSTKKVCRVCAEVCPIFAGRTHFAGLERLVRPTVSPVFARHFGLEKFDF